MEKQTDETKIAVVANEMKNMNEKMDELGKKLDKMAEQYITKLEFELFKAGDYKTVKNIVYGFAGLILIAFLGAVINFVIRK